MSGPPSDIVDQLREAARLHWGGTADVKVRAALAIHDLRQVIAAAVDELRAEHYRDEQVDGCAMCWPKDGRWPCTSALIADDLATSLPSVSSGGRSPRDAGGDGPLIAGGPSPENDERIQR